MANNSTHFENIPTASHKKIPNKSMGIMMYKDLGGCTLVVNLTSSRQLAC